MVFHLSVAKQMLAELMSWQSYVPLCTVIPKKGFCRVFPSVLLYSKRPSVLLAEEMPIQQLAHERAEEGVRAILSRFRYPSVLDIRRKTRGSEEVRGHQNTCV